jgi:hypothetical protein
MTAPIVRRFVRSKGAGVAYGDSRPLGERVLPERRVLVSPDRGSGWTR